MRARQWTNVGGMAQGVPAHTAGAGAAAGIGTGTEAAAYVCLEPEASALAG